ncbi:hypothetical protein Pcinc_011701 [Petrolisthes cinctipes]|uniref:Uncharacterized protein n=1 Tax=Petrolisthes cinctipes TaxID=88211 RepID=A0AAE1KU74_PETCI|nr:hypothetical protein Pcinc_011701 [Petrolisthes cinctipes]
MCKVEHGLRITKYSIHPGPPETHRGICAPLSPRSPSLLAALHLTRHSFVSSQLVLVGSVEFRHQFSVPQSFQALRHLTQSNDAVVWVCAVEVRIEVGGAVLAEVGVRLVTSPADPHLATHTSRPGAQPCLLFSCHRYCNRVRRKNVARYTLQQVPARHHKWSYS